ncbi:MAG: nucleotidyltransferase family protein [bacterium]
MKGIVLSAGKGTRLGQYTRNIPKVMLEIGGKPVLEHGILLLKKHGIEEIFLNLHYCPQVIQDYFGDGRKWGVHIRYHFEEGLLGTAGAVKAFEEQIGWGEEVLVLYGDNLTNCNLTALRRFHREKRGMLTLSFIESEDVHKSGIIAFNDNHRIVRMLEKPKPDEVFSHFVNAGVLVMEPAVFGLIPQGIFYDFGYHLLPRMISEGMEVYAYPMDGFLISIDTPEYYHQAQEIFRLEAEE